MKKVKKNFNIARIKVIGVGGGGGNAISRMASRDRIRGVEFVAINTDAQDLEYAVARKKLYIGKTATKGLGTGMNPELGKQAAEENKNDIAEVIKGSDAVFITAGLGGGTGSGAAPIVAEIAREAGVLTIAVVTKPFSFEGSQRMRIAQEALGSLKDKVDTLIVIPNDRIFNIIDKNTSLIKAFEFVDDVLRNAVQAVSDLVVSPGLINVDFADIKAVMKDAGAAVVGIGQSSGNDRALKAVSQAISSPLLEVSMEGAKGVLFSVSGGKDLRMSEISDIAKVIVENMDPGARVIFGAYHDRRVKANQLKVTLIATGFNGLGPARIFGQQNSSLLFNLPSLEEKKPVKELVLEDVPPAAPVNEEKSEDKWDIPAFLRRKKKK